MKSPSIIELFGTDEPVPQQRLLRAEPLTAILEDGNLRYIRFNGVEVVRAINYLARNGAWATYQARLSNLLVTEERDRFEVSYEGTCRDDRQMMSYRMRIEGRADGRLIMQGDSVAMTDFETNRVGFVILHPGSAAGGRLVIEHSDGSKEETVFPLHVMADQPAFDIAALTHDPAPGLSCTVRMEGDAFEMEDQRNWTDASFKTYVRPLSKPRPYVMPEGAHDLQRIEIEITSSRVEQVRSSPVVAERKLGRMPEIALFTDESVPGSGYAIAPGSANRVILRLHAKGDNSAFLFAAHAAARAGIEACVEIIFDALDCEAEAQEALARIAAAGIHPTALLVSCRRDFKTRQSGTIPDNEASVAELISALHGAGFQGNIGAGTPSNFTEFNRNPPPPECDFIYFAISATVHAADDMSVVETLEAYPDVIESARALCPDKPLWLVPCTLAPRHNPYGDALALNPDVKRVVAASLDPRQNALFGAAFAVGIAAEAVRARIDTISLAAPAGTFGRVASNGTPYPIDAVNSMLASAAGSLAIEIPAIDQRCRAVGWLHSSKRTVLIANLSPESASIDASSYRALSWLEPGEWSETRIIRHSSISIPPYRTVLVSDQRAMSGVSTDGTKSA